MSRSFRFTAPLFAALLAASFGAFGCRAANQLEGKIAGLEQIADQAQRNGAKKCTPRELAMARAHLQFAREELERGSVSRAERHVVLAEQNADAAFLQAPPQYCLGEGPAAAPGDSDGDGFLDEEDRCPLTPEVFNGLDDGDGCPDDPDTDGDGIPDAADLCVVTPEDVDGYLDTDGCPEPDNDLDGKADFEDECPNEPEDPDGYEDDDGCPDPDNDGDGVLDPVDECPNTPGQNASAPLGCPLQPALVVVTDCEVKIVQQIHFETKKSIIKRESYPILDAVVEVLQKNSSIKLEVQGHTDDVGTNKYNLTLSTDRAAAVRKYLVGRGVEASRLASKGYGEEVPIVPNDSAENRGLNRRVQFVRTEGGKAECSADAQKPAESAN